MATVLPGFYAQFHFSDYRVGFCFTVYFFSHVSILLAVFIIVLHYQLLSIFCFKMLTHT